MNDTILQLESICYRHRPALPLIDNLSFSVKSGETIWITGPAGSGKTTLMEILIGERKTDSGTGVFLEKPLFGRKCWRRSELRKAMGIILQDDYVMPENSVFDNVAVPLRVVHAPERLIRDRVTQTLRSVDLLGKGSNPMSALSTTERRLVTLARVMVKRPPLILADLNSCEVDQKIVVRHLESMATYGSGVIFFSKTKSTQVSSIAETHDMSLG